jgi:predicted nucleic acid-binding protein
MMKTVFADTGYWIALLDPQDTLHSKAINLSITFTQVQIVTSEMVLTEILNHFSKRGNFLRYAAANFIESLQENPSITIIPQTDSIFQQALILYKQRPDQAWSHTDCSSFCIMQQQNILEALAYDKHFEQAGFIALLRY